MDAIIEHIEYHRKAQKIKKGDLAEQAGISKAAYSRIINGKAGPQLETFQKLCDVLGIEIQLLKK